MTSLLSKTTTFALLSLAVLVAGAMPVSATTVTVTLRVDASITFPFDEPAFRTYGTACDVTVSAGANGGAVLDQAVTNGCIDGWSYSTFSGFGKYVTGIKGHNKATSTEERPTVWPCQEVDPFDPEPSKIVASSWVGLLNPPAYNALNPPPFQGLDQYSAQDGDVLMFAYVVDNCAFTNALAVGVANVFVGSPVPIAGNCLTDPDGL